MPTYILINVILFTANFHTIQFWLSYYTILSIHTPGFELNSVGWHFVHINLELYYIIKFTSLCKNFFTYLRLLAETFRCHMHNFQCPSRPPSNRGVHFEKTSMFFFDAIYRCLPMYRLEASMIFFKIEYFF